MPCLATLTLSLAAVGPWTYAGFLDDPTPPPPPAPAPTPAVPATPTVPPAPSPESSPTPAPALSRSATPPVASVPPPVGRTPAVLPVAYRMPDAAGQVWEHADPAWLRTFVLDRNLQLARPCTTASCR